MSGVSFRQLGDEGLVRGWDELADSASAGPFSRAGWFRVWAEAFGHPVEVAVTQDGAALIPLIRTARGVVSATNEHSPEFASVAETDDAKQRLFRDLLADNRQSYHFMKLAEADIGPLRAAARNGRMREEIVQRSPYLELAGDWESYELSLNASFRQGLRRKERRLRESGEVSVEFVADGEDLDERLSEGFAIEGSMWKAAAGTAIASDARTVAFYTEIARWAAERGWLRLWSLKRDGVAVAFRFDLEVAGVYYHLKGGYDPELARYSPGLLLQHASVKAAFDAGLTRYEFLGADEDYKLKWAKTKHERYSVRIFGRGVRGTFEWFDRAVARPAAKRILARTRDR